MKPKSQNLSRKLCLMVVTFFIVTTLWAQQKVVTGKVIDDRGDPLPGVTVVVEGTTIGTITDIEGVYQLNISTDVLSLVYSFIGVEDQKVLINNQTIIDVQMIPSSIGMDEVVVVGYGTQKKISVTGALSTVRSEELMASPNASVANALAGKVTGLSSVQYSGQPGQDDAQIFVRGIGTLNPAESSPLMMVDGVERSFTQLDPNEIADITVLKDASATAVYGVRGANGVILVTTKRGQKGRAKISLSTSYGFQQPTRLPEFADSYTYATVHNNASRGDGVAEDELKFSEDVVEAFRTNSDPFLYPNTDWMDYLSRDFVPQSMSNVNISGGTDRVKYFASFGYLNQEGMLKEFDSGTGENYGYERYNYRTNMDIKVTKSTDLSFSLGGQTQVRNEPAKGDVEQIWRFVYGYAVPWTSPGIVDGKYYRTNEEYIPIKDAKDPLELYYGGGSSHKVNNKLNFDLTLKQDLSVLTKGLKIRVKGAYNASASQQKVQLRSVNVYESYYDRDYDDALPDDDETLVHPLVERGGRNEYNEYHGKNRDWYLEAALTYDRKFGDHEVSGLLLYNQRNNYYIGGGYDYIPRGYIGSAARFTYNFKTKYLAEINMGYNGSENFHEDYRYGLFPAVSLGWIPSEEDFMKNNVNFINYLKVRGSYGLVGSDSQGGNRFLYLPDSYTSGGSYSFGVNVPSNLPGVYESKLGNKKVTWETAQKQNYGVDMIVFDNHLTVNFDYFLEDRVDILTTRQTVPGVVAATMPAVNIGKVHNEGYEISVRWDQTIGDFHYWLNPNISHARNHIVFKDEVYKPNAYQYQTGKLVGQPFGFLTDGFYADDDFDAEGKLLISLPQPSGEMKPGDAKYVDVNSDMVINTDDYTPIGHPEYPLTNMGFNSGFRYKDWDFSMSWVAATEVSRSFKETLSNPFSTSGVRSLLQWFVDDGWTPETAETATLPRISFTNQLHNNSQNSEFWTVDASYIRLKNIEIGYNFRGKLLRKIGAEKLRVYANGYNLLTFDKLDGLVDPESRTNSRPSYPVMKVYNLGLSVNF